MFKRLIQWLKNFFSGLFGAKKTTTRVNLVREEQTPPPLDDTDLEFLFTELLEGVHQARGQSWALRWLKNLEHRVSQQRWLEWLEKFGSRLLASNSANNEIAARMVQLGELEVGVVGDTAYDLGMQLLTRNQPEPIWEYVGPDAIAVDTAVDTNNQHLSSNVGELGEDAIHEASIPAQPAPDDGGYQTITVEQLFELIQQDPSLRQNLAQQVGLETDDPEIIIQAVVNHLQTAGMESGDGRSEL